MAETYWDLFFAYSSLWLILSIYIVRMLLKQQELARKVQALEKKE